MRIRFCAAVLAALCAAYSQSGSSPKLEFEIASVKHTANVGPVGRGPQRSGNRFTMHNAQISSIIYYAYHLKGNYELIGDLGYGSDEWNSFNIDAVIGGDASEDQVRLMLQSLLADRFQLKMHRETRELPGYQMSVAKGGPKLSPSGKRPMELSFNDRDFSQPEGTCSVTAWREGTRIICHATTIEQLISATAGNLRAPVVDRTGLKGTYDVSLLYLPESRRVTIEAGDETFGPSLEQAFQEQLGLKIEKSKVPVEVIVIDQYIKTPSEN